MFLTDGFINGVLAPQWKLNMDEEMKQRTRQYHLTAARVCIQQSGFDGALGRLRRLVPLQQVIKHLMYEWCCQTRIWVTMIAPAEMAPGFCYHDSYIHNISCPPTLPNHPKMSNLQRQSCFYRPGEHQGDFSIYQACQFSDTPVPGQLHPPTNRNNRAGKGRISPDICA